MLKMFVIGHLGQDATVKDVNGKKVISFSVAHTEKYTAGGVPTEKTTWISCGYWQEKVAIAQYLKKGTQVFVEGVPSSAGYTNKEGKVASDLRLNVRSIQLLSGKQGTGAQGGTGTEAPQATAGVGEDFTPINVGDETDLPF